MTEQEPNGWGQYKLLILHEIERLDARITADFKAHLHNDERLAEELNATLEKIESKLTLLNESQVKIREDVAGLKVQASVVGGIAGMISSFIGTLFNRP